MTTWDLKPRKLSRCSTFSPRPPFLDPGYPQFQTLPSRFPGVPPGNPHHLGKTPGGWSPAVGLRGRGRPWRQEAGKVAPKVPRPGESDPRVPARASWRPRPFRTLARPPRRPRRPPPRGSPHPPPRAPGPGAPRASAVASPQRCRPDAVSSGGPGPPAAEPGAAVPAPRRSATPTHPRPGPRPPGGPATPPTLTAAALAAAAAVFVHLEAAAAAGEPGAGGRGAAGAERAGGRAAPAARGPGRGPGLLPRGGALSARRRRHVARRPRPGRGGRGPAGPPRERARPRPEPRASETAPWRAGASILWTDVGSGEQNLAARGLGGPGAGVLLALALSEKAQETYLKVKPSPFVQRHFRVIPAFQPFLGCHGGPPFLAMSAL